MGVYSTVMAELDCQRCGRMYRTDVHFKTGNDYEMPQYEEGQVVGTLSPGSTFEGTADAFCADCLERWRADEKAANFEELARSVESGDIQARFATYATDIKRLELGRQLKIFRQEPLTPAEVRALGNTKDDGPGWPTFGARLLQASVTLFREERPLDDSPGTWWWDHQERVRQRLSAQRWRRPADWYTCDLTVRVDDRSRIGVTPLPVPEPGPQE